MISIGLSFFLTLVLFRDEAEEEPAEEAAGEPAAEAPATSASPIELVSPMTGKVLDIAQVPDQVFASGALGEGVAILPTDGHVYAPCDAEVSAVMDTKHAIGLTTEDGLELLIHVGLDTVKLEGKPFEYAVSEGDKVRTGDLLLTADLDMIVEAGYKIHTPVLVTNSDDYESVKIAETTAISKGDHLMTIA